MESTVHITNPINAMNDMGIGLYKISTSFRAPASVATDTAKKHRGKIQFLVKRLNGMPMSDIEKFIDHLTDLVSYDLNPEDLEDSIKQIDEIGQIGHMLKSIETNMERMSDAEKIKFFIESIRFNIDMLDKMYRKIGIEVLKAESEETFDYLLVSQSILLKSKKMLEAALFTIECDDTIGSEEANLISEGLYGVLRVESFRRGKISLVDLENTYTFLTTALGMQKYQIQPVRPDWLVDN